MRAEIGETGDVGAAGHESPSPIVQNSVQSRRFAGVRQRIFCAGKASNGKHQTTKKFKTSIDQTSKPTRPVL